MILEYTILWFENDPIYASGLENDISEYLKNWGYNPKLVVKADESDLMQIMDRENVDLILMDQNLDKGQKGDTIIRRIRDNELYTEAVLYSQDLKFKEKLSEDLLEGVFFAYRKDLLDKIKKIIDLTIKKNQDITNIRGLFIAESIYLAGRMEEILSKILRLTGEPLQFFTDQIVQDDFFTDYSKFCIIQRFLRAKTKFINRKLESATGTDKTTLESFKTKIADAKKQLGNFEKLMNIRNQLAHAKKHEEEKNVLFIRSRSGNIAEKRYDENECKNIREQFLEFSAGLNDLLKLLDDIIATPILNS